LAALSEQHDLPQHRLCDGYAEVRLPWSRKQPLRGAADSAASRQTPRIFRCAYRVLISAYRKAVSRYAPTGAITIVSVGILLPIPAAGACVAAGPFDELDCAVGGDRLARRSSRNSLAHIDREDAIAADEASPGQISGRSY
jgi:hypothetical protein